MTDDETPPFAHVRCDGAVTIGEDLATMLDWSRRIALRYVGAERSEAHGRRNAVPGELLVRLTPDRTVAEAGVAD